jgi:plasmid stabilization system protein ParE
MQFRLWRGWKQILRAAFLWRRYAKNCSADVKRGASERPEAMYQVILTAESLDDLERIELFITRKASAATAERYVESIRQFCETLRYAPHRGQQRSHLRQELRSIGFKRRSPFRFLFQNRIERCASQEFGMAAIKGIANEDTSTPGKDRLRGAVVFLRLNCGSW